MTTQERLAELLARTPRLTAGYGAPDDYTRAADWLLEHGVTVGPASPVRDPGETCSQCGAPAIVMRDHQGYPMKWHYDPPVRDPAPPDLRAIIDNFTIWRDHLLKWWEDHAPNERDLEIARAEISRPEVMAEIERLNAVRGVRDPSPPDRELRALLNWARDIETLLEAIFGAPDDERSTDENKVLYVYDGLADVRRQLAAAVVACGVRGAGVVPHKEPKS